MWLEEYLGKYKKCLVLVSHSQVCVCVGGGRVIPGALRGWRHSQVRMKGREIEKERVGGRKGRGAEAGGL